MMQLLLDLLRGLEAAIPPSPNCHHAITYAQYGSDSDGWTDKLALQISVNGKFKCLFLDEEDFLDINHAIEEVKKHLHI